MNAQREPYDTWQPVGSNTGGSAIFVWWPSPQFRPDWRCRTSYWDWL